MKLNTEQLNNIVQADNPQMRLITNKGADQLFLKKIRQEKCHTTSKELDITKVSTKLI